MRYKRFSANCISGVKHSHQRAIGQAGRNVRSRRMATRSGVVQRRENPMRWSCDEQKYMFRCVISNLFLLHAHPLTRLQLPTDSLQRRWCYSYFPLTFKYSDLWEELRCCPGTATCLRLLCPFFPCFHLPAVLLGSPHRPQDRLLVLCTCLAEEFAHVSLCFCGKARVYLCGKNRRIWKLLLSFIFQGVSELIFKASVHIGKTLKE